MIPTSSRNLAQCAGSYSVRRFRFVLFVLPLDHFVYSTHRGSGSAESAADVGTEAGKRASI
jgi:hypothetical protein